MRLSNKLSSLLLGLLISTAPAMAKQEPITLNFKDVDIDSVIGAYGHLLNRTFIIDPRVRGKISLATSTPIKPEQAYQMLLTALRMQGYSIVENGNIFKVVPETEAKLQSTSVYNDSSTVPQSERVITQIFKIKSESASNILQVIRPLLSQNSSISAHHTTNTLVITDYGTNLRRISRIIQTLDVAENEVEIVAVKNSSASDIAVQLSRLLDDSSRSEVGPNRPGPVVDSSSRVIIGVDSRTNSILIRSSNQSRIKIAKNIIAQLDQPQGETGNIRVVHLRNAEASKLMQVLKTVMLNEPTKSAAVPGQNQSPAAGPNFQHQENTNSFISSGVNITADISTNSLIITAPEPVYRNLRSVIDKLDTRRAQVYIESLIVEVSAEKSTELGIQWQFLSAPNGSNSLIGGTNLPARGGGSNILDATTNISSLGRGLNIGLVRAESIIGGAAGSINLGLLARALETEAGANILATPNLLTLDNEEAKIIIGQNVPFITGSFVNSGAAAGAVNPFQTIERKDVGTTLRVKPQIAEGGTVKMQIFQEVSSVQDASLSAGLITNKRAIESNVLVDDGEVVVLGGLIEERVDGGISMVPGLGRLPILGNLFRYDNRKKVKTNLLVFLRPVVLRDLESSRRLSADRYDYIQEMRSNIPITPSEIIRENQYWPGGK